MKIVHSYLLYLLRNEPTYLTSKFFCFNFIKNTNITVKQFIPLQA